jgi:hypothetical protein
VRRFAVAGLALAVAGCGARAVVVPPDGAVAPPPIATALDGGARLAPQVQQAVPAPVVKPPPPKVKIVVSSQPGKAEIFWGKKSLGKTPLTIERPRDSGPMDLVLRREGFFPVHVRAYSFRSDKVGGVLTKLGDRMTLFGAKKELAPDAAPTVPDPSAKPTDAPKH